MILGALAARLAAYNRSMNFKGAFKLFQFAGIRVWAHWLWIAYLVYRVVFAGHFYQNRIWALIECLSVFVIVLLHEFGHSFAARSVGGRSDDIILWLFGGISFCEWPRRAGAMLWVVIAGPLVNVALIPILYLVGKYAGSSPDNEFDLVHMLIRVDESSDAMRCLVVVSFTNIGMLCFNLLPVYPLDGGKLLWSFIWFFSSEGQSLMAASTIGRILAIGLGILFFMGHQYFGVFMAFWLFAEAQNGYRRGQAILDDERNGFSP